MHLARTNVFLSVAPGFVGNDRGLKKPDDNQYDEKRNAPGNNIVMLSEKRSARKIRATAAVIHKTMRNRLPNSSTTSSKDEP
jgi:hypothetical protein